MGVDDYPGWGQVTFWTIVISTPLAFAWTFFIVHKYYKNGSNHGYGGHSDMENAGLYLVILVVILCIISFISSI